MAFRKQVIFIAFGLLISILSAVALDSFLGSLLLATTQDTVTIAESRRGYLSQLSEEEMAGSSISYASKTREESEAKQKSIVFILLVSLVCSLIGLAVVGLITRYFVKQEDDRLVLKSVFWLSLIAISGLYKAFPLRETPLGESVMEFFLHQWEIWGAVIKN